MAVYTDISEEALAEFLHQYDIGTLLSYRGITEGVENSNFMLHTTVGHFILTLYEKRVKQEDLPFFLHLMQHLSAHGMACPQPVMRRDGHLIGHLAQRPAAIVSFLEGVWIRRPTVHHCAGVGQALARLHLASQDFILSRSNGLGVSDWRHLWQKIRGQAEAITAGLEDEIESELALLEQTWPQHLPQGVIHADLFPDNVFFIAGKLSGLIDFYFACNDMLAYDLAICLNAWCFEADFSYNLTKGHALLSAYQTVRPLDQQEHEWLPILARGAALRFFMTRAYDWFHTEISGQVVKKNPMEYLRKSRFFRQIKRADELGLLS